MSAPNPAVRRVPTAYYMLALSWSPEWCRTHPGSRADALQCGGNRFRFVLHGLWPNGSRRTHPGYCAPAPAIPFEVLRKHLCMTPSPSLMQHEWAAHGTCGWRDSGAYFDQAAALWNSLRLPSLEDDRTRPRTAGELRAAFARANPGLPRSAVFVDLDNRRRLTEARICYDLRFRPAACPAGRGAPDELAIRITPPA